MKYQVLLFYKYVTVADPLQLKNVLISLCTHFNLNGRIIVAEEGLNFTAEGAVEDTENFLKEFLKDERFADVQIKRSEGTGASFPRLSIKVRNEIVATRFPKEVDPTKQTGKYLKPEELRRWYKEDKDFVVVDMRNSYEFESGHFQKSIDPGMIASRELPDLIEKIKKETEGKTILTVCTGGVRCEKMSAYLLHEGFDKENVYQLDGGMHSYMEKYPGKDFLGTLFTFDDRLVMDFGGDREVIGKCKRCDAPNEQYQNCANAECNMLFLICNNCMSTEGSGFCSEKCEKSTVRVVQRVRG
ncbi:MAG: rhodanese-related sulfurtransferase [Candidatus Paceibacterota bacterium]|jgi:UPF0176 protein